MQLGPLSMRAIQETLHMGNKLPIILPNGARSKQAQQNTDLNIMDVELDVMEWNFFTERIYNFHNFIGWS